MIVWRLARAERRALDGEGGRLAGGRWTPPGYPVVHTAATAALAALERLVHTDSDIPGVQLALFEIEVPDRIAATEVLIGTLLPTWRTTPAPESLQSIGLAWILSRETCVLSVPSAIVPRERNYLLNPVHPDFRRVTLNGQEPFAFDARLR
ncbi:MAG: RES family NAD+ phosphorylase [Vicinamibacterales bacterium]